MAAIKPPMYQPQLDKEVWDLTLRSLKGRVEFRKHATLQMQQNFTPKAIFPQNPTVQAIKAPGGNTLLSTGGHDTHIGTHKDVYGSGFERGIFRALDRARDLHGGFLTPQQAQGVINERLGKIAQDAQLNTAYEQQDAAREQKAQAKSATAQSASAAQLALQGPNPSGHADVEGALDAIHKALTAVIALRPDRAMAFGGAPVTPALTALFQAIIDNAYQLPINDLNTLNGELLKLVNCANQNIANNPVTASCAGAVQKLIELDQANAPLQARQREMQLFQRQHNVDNNPANPANPVPANPPINPAIPPPDNGPGPRGPDEGNNAPIGPRGGPPPPQRPPPEPKVAALGTADRVLHRLPADSNARNDQRLFGLAIVDALYNPDFNWGANTWDFVTYYTTGQREAPGAAHTEEEKMDLYDEFSLRLRRVSQSVAFNPGIPNRLVTRQNGVDYANALLAFNYGRLQGERVAQGRGFHNPRYLYGGAAGDSTDGPDTSNTGNNGDAAPQVPQEDAGAEATEDDIQQISELLAQYEDYNDDDDDDQGFAQVSHFIEAPPPFYDTPDLMPVPEPVQTLPGHTERAPVPSGHGSFPGTPWPIGGSFGGHKRTRASEMIGAHDEATDEKCEALRRACRHAVGQMRGPEHTRKLLKAMNFTAPLTGGGFWGGALPDFNKQVDYVELAAMDLLAQQTPFPAVIQALVEP